MNERKDGEESKMSNKGDQDRQESHPATTEELEIVVLDVLKRANVSPELIYAFKKTGRLVTEMNKTKLSKEDIEEWDNAIAEYLRNNPKIK
jgi:hypothetical protein